jgi:hypothetical protein
MRARLEGTEPTPLELDFPAVVDGARETAAFVKQIDFSPSDRVFDEAFFTDQRSLKRNAGHKPTLPGLFL